MSGIYISNIINEKDELNKKFNSLNNVEFKSINFQGLTICSFTSSYSKFLNNTELEKDIFIYDSLCISYQGKIYNLDEIVQQLLQLGIQIKTKNESEVILLGYKTWGERLFSKLNGLFILSIFDSLNKKIICARDRFGIKPCYYSWKNGIVEICSRLQPLINKESKISEEAIAYFFNYGYIPTPISIVSDIRKLKPAHYLIIDLSTNIVNEYPYWDLYPVETNNISYNDAKSELHELIKDAVKIRIEPDKAIGTFLSGGVDSSIVTSILAKQANTQISSYTIAFDNPKFDERNIAKQYSELIGTKHHEFIFSPENALELIDKLVEVYDEPFADSSALPTLFLSSKSHEFTSIAFTGDGGDENFLAQGQFASIKKFEKLKMIPFFARKLLSNFVNDQRIKNILTTLNNDQFMNISLYGTEGYLLNNTSLLNIDKYYLKYKNLSNSSVQNLADFSIKFLWENGYNVKVERANSSYSINLRSPLLDYRIVEFARKLPIGYRLDGNSGKKILKDILEDYIPRNVFEQPKKGFSMPLGLWIRSILKDEVMTNIELHHEKRFSFFNSQKFELLLKNHMSGIEDNSLYIWRVYILNKWLDKYKL